MRQGSQRKPIRQVQAACKKPSRPKSGVSQRPCPAKHMYDAEGWISTAWDKFAGPEDNSAADKVNAAAETLKLLASSASASAAVGLEITSVQLTDAALSLSGSEILISCQDFSGKPQT